jgi:ESCRT-I complex subunit VPS28
MSTQLIKPHDSNKTSRPKYDEIKQFHNTKEKYRCENLADFFAIIRVTESLEAAFSRDAVSTAEYTDACNKLISQYKTSEAALISSGAIKSAEQFFHDFQIDCPRAYERLVKACIPATFVHAAHDNRLGPVIQATQAYITAMDALKLEQRAADQLQPLIKDVTSTLGKVTVIPPDFDGLIKMKLWLTKFQQMKAADELNEQEARQILFDLESGYNAFVEYSNDHK